MSVDTSSKKRKVKSKGASTTSGTAAEASFSLLGTKRDTDLDEVFGKSSAYVAPAAIPPATQNPSSSTSLASDGITTATIPDSTRKAKVSRKRARTPETKEEAPVEQAQTTAGPSKILPPASLAAQDSADGSDDDAAEGMGNLVHESLQPKRKRTASKGKYVPPNETSADRDRRTLFLGNLPIDVAKSKSALHQLHAHLLTFAPTAKIESTRFRSVAFATPTTSVPGEDGEKGEAKQKGREQERARKWKEEQEVLHKGGKEAEEADKSLSFLDAKGKRKVAFIKKDFHDDSATCNAYIVFAHPHPDRSANVSPIMDPYEAASKVLNANGSSFMSRTIRVDTVRLPSSKALESATTALSKRNAWLPAGTDTKKSLFVGGLDYAAKEEDVRAFFEELVKAERGARDGGGRWVESVRLVRDKATQMGKGFGYVHFADRESADEIIALPSTKLKFAKKPLRVQACKTLPPTTASRPSAISGPGPSSTNGKATSKSDRPVRPSSIPKGDPSLGDRLKSLSKEDRKLAKSADADRAARRLAKKKVRVAARFEEKGAVKLGASRAEKRDRVGKEMAKAKKPRVRSQAAVAKMKGSRA